MISKKAQQQDIKYYYRFIRKCRKHEWLLDTPIKYIEKLFVKRHKMHKRKSYSHAATDSLDKVPNKLLSFYRDELLADTLLRKKYFKAIDVGKFSRDAEKYEVRFDSEGNIVNYYALIREIRPKIVLETGTAAGVMSSWVLSALHKNNEGKLISIDLPAIEGKLTMGMTLHKSDLGLLIPEEYYEHWQYHVGDSKILLPKLLVENNVDVFIHDSLHTRTHMLFEYNCARCLMKRNSIIMSDDILWNQAFFLFVESHKLKYLSCISNPNLGFTVNQFDEYEEYIGTEIVRL